MLSRSDVNPPNQKLNNPTDTNVSNNNSRLPQDEWTIVDDYYDDYVSDTEVEEDFSTKPVPIWLSIFLVIGYIVGGAYLFRVCNHFL